MERQKVHDLTCVVACFLNVNIADDQLNFIMDANILIVITICAALITIYFNPPC